MTRSSGQFSVKQLFVLTLVGGLIFALLRVTDMPAWMQCVIGAYYLAYAGFVVWRGPGWWRTWMRNTYHWKQIRAQRELFKAEVEQHRRRPSAHQPRGGADS